tara:strand:- start:2812 stop:3678 length:867 start_codon:yes stop_codon:yes gene_type:complete
MSGVIVPPSDDGEQPKDYGQFTIGQVPAQGIEVGFDSGTNQWWYRIETPILRRVIDLLGCLVDEAAFYFTDVGFYCRVVDPSHVCMMALQTPGCRDSGGNNESDMVYEEMMGVELSKLLKCIDKTESHITIVVESDTGKLRIVNDNCESMLRALDRQNMQSPKIPDFSGMEVTTFEIDSITWLKSCKRMDDVADLVSLETNENGVYWSAGGESFKREYKLTDTYTGEEITAQYSNQYVLGLAKKQPITKKNHTTFKVSFGKNYPLLIESIDDIVNWQYFLAPRIEGDA